MSSIPGGSRTSFSFACLPSAALAALIIPLGFIQFDSVHSATGPGVQEATRGWVGAAVSRTLYHAYRAQGSTHAVRRTVTVQSTTFRIDATPTRGQMRIVFRVDRGLAPGRTRTYHVVWVGTWSAVKDEKKPWICGNGYAPLPEPFFFKQFGTGQKLLGLTHFGQRRSITVGGQKVWVVTGRVRFPKSLQRANKYGERVEFWIQAKGRRVVRWTNHAGYSRDFVNTDERFSHFGETVTARKPQACRVSNSQVS